MNFPPGHSDPSLYRRYRIGLHVLFWVGYVVYEGIVWGMIDGEYAQRMAFTLVELPIKIAATYLTLYYIIDKLLIPRRYSLFVLALSGSMVGFGIVMRIVDYYTIYPIYYPQGLNLPILYPPKILIIIFSIYSVVALLASYHLGKHWHNHQLTAQRLEKEKLESELKLLKSQINPHFLFNTLNSLYALALQQSHRTPETVHKLSGLMSYMLYDSNQDEVALKKELQYIENYIALEKLRCESKLDISFNVYSNVEGIMIAPLMILPFVENCFKHGVSRQINDSWIRIDVAFDQPTLTIKVENNKSSGETIGMKPVSGIGLQNVRKRLELIYPDRHHLEIFDEDDSYLVVLKLDLNNVSRGEDVISLKHRQA